MKTVVVLGGGITGLCTMHYLQRQVKEKNLDVQLVLVEKNTYLGGKLYSAYEQGFIMETGADSIVARHKGVMELVQELDFEDHLVYNETGISYIYTNNELHAIPADSTFGIPMSVASLEESTLISDQAKQEALKDLTLPNAGFTKESSIGEFLTYYLGEELVENQIAPVLAGVYSGDLHQLSIASTLPYLIDYKNDYGSIIKGFDANREQFVKAANKKFISFQNGLSSLIERLEQKLTEVDIIKGVATNHVQKMENKYSISLANGQYIEADYVVLALPNEAVQSILQDDSLTHYFDQFTTASAITIYLGFDVPDANLPADGTGYIVSHNSDVTCNAATWTSRKWKHTSKNNQLLVRLFYKSINPAYEQLRKMTDDELAAVALEDVRKSLGIDEKPTVVNVTKWIDQMPKYDLAHREALQGLLLELNENYPNLSIAGCSYFGVGIGACIQNGKKIGEELAEELSNF
ncbi:protoporphyrinogen oxidase [Lysinibacillus fusiformis]|uniref:protoporphyrinogen oxidase n=1 Tax=Lysinibacillus fusiformis TaxID=28031 RepID=UPI00088C5497|nr:protoporphyrinogen oxidase [Lysinibacillus fusiformis]SCX68452.1 oxygen-dependent protoporphyrinogen oxidase [Lysinibacillus fusiformis]SDB55729.1 oxygen-dependent protoporphyrinogen oxidase [Lysinibacillus fusiformis]SFJ06838.1 oxygen-dependent protoporphyrinogen oxidase [Lysinibacillus fusiformis]SFT27378.1 oxygen-dependent protoporphyrinogen oxidase [Lysinibacillus fusiformis]